MVAAPAPVATPRSVTTIDDELGRLDQALIDLERAEAVAVALIHCPAASREATLSRSLCRRATERGFAAASISLLESSLDSLDELVRALIEELVGPTGARGLIELLDVFCEKHGKKSAERFADAALWFGATGDLATLCGAYIGAADDGYPEARAFEAWLHGTEPSRRSRVEVRRALGPGTAQRALGELTRVVRALDLGGCLFVLRDGDAVTLRTPRQREKSYTVLRELVDNFDTGRGAVSTRIVVTGGDRFFDGPRSLRTLTPLLMRLEVPSEAEPPPPHRSWTSLIRDPYEYVHRRITPPPETKHAALRTLIRGCQGLPPIEAVASMSVGHERIDRTIDRLFAHTSVEGSVFTVLSGAYGSGKTHLMLHLAERSLKDGHPVFWLNLERMNLDLGNPQRHFARLLETSALPARRRPSAAERAALWTRAGARLRALGEALKEIAAASGEEAFAAHKALSISEQARDPGRALEGFLCGRDLEKRSSAPGYRQDAYRRLLLWIGLLKRLEGAGGPVFLIDEAENLYTAGMSRAARKTALRSLAFYCGGALPSACVVLAMTPEALVELKREARELLDEVLDQSSTLSWEDATLFKRRLQRLTPELVPTFTRPQRLELCARVRATHRSVRGDVAFEDWEPYIKRVTREPEPPRRLIRRLVDELEARWWAG
jgi:hypothetical protein